MRVIIYILILANILCAQNKIYKRDLSRDVKEMFSDSAEAVVDTLTSSAKDTINAFIEDSLDSSGIIDWDQLNDSAKDSIRQIISDSLSAHDALRLLNDSLYYFAYPKSVDDNPIYYWWASSEGYIYILVDSLGSGVDGDPEAIGMIRVDSLGDGSIHQFTAKSAYFDSLTALQLAKDWIRATTDSWTVEFWTYSTGIYGLNKYGGVTSGTETNKPGIYMPGYNYAGPQFERNLGPVPTVDGDSSAALLRNRWIHLAFVHDPPDSMKIYQGAVDVADTLSGYAADGFNMILSTIGALENYAARYKGYLDEMRMWNSAKTLTEINANKESELNGNETNLAYYYKFNDALTCDRIDSTNTLTEIFGTITYSTNTPF